MTCPPRLSGESRTIAAVTPTVVETCIRQCVLMALRAVGAFPNMGWITASVLRTCNRFQMGGINATLGPT